MVPAHFIIFIAPVARLRFVTTRGTWRVPLLARGLAFPRRVSGAAASPRLRKIDSARMSFSGEGVLPRLPAAQTSTFANHSFVTDMYVSLCWLCLPIQAGAVSGRTNSLDPFCVFDKNPFTYPYSVTPPGKPSTRARQATTDVD